jgi:anti-anti-sigma regulatory factor
MTLKIEKSPQKGYTVFSLSGRIDAEQVSELKRVFKLEPDAASIVVDLREIRLADRQAVKFLLECEAQGASLRNCPAYIREWMAKERG